MSGGQGPGGAVEATENNQDTLNYVKNNNGQNIQTNKVTCKRNPLIEFNIKYHQAAHTNAEFDVKYCQNYERNS